MPKTQRNSRRRDAPWIGAAMLWMLCAATPSLHAEIVTRTVPTTTAHFFSSHPMIAGTVVSVNDHELLVDTPARERVTLEVDSRTMAPRDLTPGMTVRTEFAALEDGRFRAERVIVIRTGMAQERFQAYANTPEGRELMVSNELLASNHRARLERVNTADGADHAATMTASWQAPGSVRRARPDPLPGTWERDERTFRTLSGTVQSANDHQVVLETAPGRTVEIVMDSRTMLPRDLAHGSGVRAQVRKMRDGTEYAQRIRLLGPDEAYLPNDNGSSSSTIADRGDEPSAGGGSTSVASSESGGKGDHAGAPDRDGSATKDRERSRSGRTLPDTASRRPLLLLLGLLGLGSAGALMVRRLRSA